MNKLWQWVQGLLLLVFKEGNLKSIRSIWAKFPIFLWMFRAFLGKIPLPITNLQFKKFVQESIPTKCHQWEVGPHNSTYRGAKTTSIRPPVFITPVTHWFSARGSFAPFISAQGPLCSHKSAIFCFADPTSAWNAIFACLIAVVVGDSAVHVDRVIALPNDFHFWRVGSPCNPGPICS